MTVIEKPKLTIVDGQPMTTSLAVAEHFGKLHKNVLRAIDRLECSPEFHRLNFEPMSLPGHRGNCAVVHERAIRISRDGFAFLAMGFTGKEAARWKEAYINAFNLMERTLRQPAAAPAAQVTSSMTPLDLTRHAIGGYEITRELLMELHSLLEQSVSLTVRLQSAASAVTGLDEVGMALQLTGMRVPDAQLFVSLANKSNPPRSADAPQWVQVSCRQLSIELAWSTPGKVRAALDRLRTFGLIDVRFAQGRFNRLEYRVDMARAGAVLSRLGDQATDVAALRDAFSVRSSSPMADLIRRAAPRVNGAMSAEADQFNMRSTMRGGHLTTALLDDTPMGLNAVIKMLQSVLEAHGSSPLLDEPQDLLH